MQLLIELYNCNINEYQMIYTSLVLLMRSEDEMVPAWQPRADVEEDDGD